MVDRARDDRIVDDAGAGERDVQRLEKPEIMKEMTAAERSTIARY